MRDSKKRVALPVAIALVALAVVLFAISGGSKLKGTYVSEEGISQTFTFNGDEVTMSAFGINVIGQYKISGDQISITYSIFGMNQTWTQSFSKSGNTINIGGTNFVKR